MKDEFDWDGVYVTKSSRQKEVVISFVTEEGYGSVIIPPSQEFPECNSLNPPEYCERLP